ncbi:MAG: hypothetical protein AAFO80_12565 [Pseudomonadota bacterium]
MNEQMLSVNVERVNRALHLLSILDDQLPPIYSEPMGKERSGRCLALLDAAQRDLEDLQEDLNLQEKPG